MTAGDEEEPMAPDVALASMLMCSALLPSVFSALVVGVILGRGESVEESYEAEGVLWSALVDAGGVCEDWPV